MIDFSQSTKLRKEQLQFAERLRASNFSPALFRDLYEEGSVASKYKAVNTFFKLTLLQQYKLMYKIGLAMRNVSWIRYENTFKGLARYSQFPSDLFYSMLDPNSQLRPNNNFHLQWVISIKKKKVKNSLKKIFRFIEVGRSRLLNLLFRY